MSEYLQFAGQGQEGSLYIDAGEFQRLRFIRRRVKERLAATAIFDQTFGHRTKWQQREIGHTPRRRPAIKKSVFFEKAQRLTCL